MSYECTHRSHGLHLTMTLTSFTLAYLVIASNSLTLQLCQHLIEPPFTHIGTASELLSLMLIQPSPQILGETAWLKPTWGKMTSYSCKSGIVLCVLHMVTHFNPHNNVQGQALLSVFCKWHDRDTEVKKFAQGHYTWWRQEPSRRATQRQMF